MELTTVWFALIAVFWIGYLCLEGFDFGVGMLLPVLSRSEAERRVVINTIGPVWDGNEVWVLVAGGATFAAFPEWYATLFSGFYLPMLLILLALIVRGVPIDADLEYVGGLVNLLNPYALLGGATTLLLFLTHGALFLALKTDGEIRHRARD